MDMTDGSENESHRTERLAGAFKALSDLNRLHILRCLRFGSFGVLELCRILSLSQSLLSHHLKILAEAHLVETQKEGTWVFYRRALACGEQPLRLMLKSLYNIIDTSVDLTQDIRDNLSTTLLERSNTSKEFFSKISEKFTEMSSKIADFPSYKETLFKVVKSLSSGSSFEHAVEIGPGNGELLKFLCKESDKVTAVDMSQEMLNFTKKSVSDDKLTFVEGNVEDLPILDFSTDLVVMNMVLHHVSSPNKALEETHRVLKKNGHLVVVDLFAHDQEWVRENCGHLWLGFSFEAIKSLAEDVGLKIENTIYIGLKNGFQIQIIVLKNHDKGDKNG